MSRTSRDFAQSGFSDFNCKDGNRFLKSRKKGGKAVEFRIKKEGTELKKRYIITAVIIILILAASAAVIKMYNDLQRSLEYLSAMPVSDIDITKIPDGTYGGSYEAFPVSVKVSVTVTGGKITDIELTEHVNGRGKPAEAITDRVIGAQSLDVDIISGATHSSKVILKAIEDALSSAS